MVGTNLNYFISEMNFGKINRFEQISNMGPSAYMAHNLPEGMEPGLKKTAFLIQLIFFLHVGRINLRG